MGIQVSRNFRDMLDSRIRVPQEFCDGFRPHKITLPKGVILPIAEDAEGNIFIDHENGVEAEAKDNIVIDADSASVALQLQLRSRDPRIFYKLVRALPYKEDIPLNEGQIDPGASTYGWRLFDKVGKAKLIGPDGIPNQVELIGQELTAKVKNYGIGYTITRDEIRAMILAEVPIRSEKQMAAIRAMEEAFNYLAYLGEPTIPGDTGLLNNALVGNTQTDNTGTGTTRPWTLKTNAQRLVNVIALSTSLRAKHLGRVRPDTLILPVTYADYCATPYNDSNASNVTLGEMIQRSLASSIGLNPETQSNTIQIKFRYEALTAGTGASAMMALYERSPELMEFMVSLPTVFYPDQYFNFQMAVPGEAKAAGFVLRSGVALEYQYGI